MEAARIVAAAASAGRTTDAVRPVRGGKTPSPRAKSVPDCWTELAFAPPTTPSPRGASARRMRVTTLSYECSSRCDGGAFAFHANGKLRRRQ